MRSFLLPQKGVAGVVRHAPGPSERQQYVRCSRWTSVIRPRPPWAMRRAAYRCSRQCAVAGGGRKRLRQRHINRDTGGIGSQRLPDSASWLLPLSLAPVKQAWSGARKPDRGWRMSSALSSLQSRSAQWAAEEPSVGATVRRRGPGVERQLPAPPPASAGFILTRFLMTFCIGVAATLAWQILRRCGERDDRALVPAACLVGTAGRAGGAGWAGRPCRSFARSRGAQSAIVRSRRGAPTCRSDRGPARRRPGADDGRHHQQAASSRAGHP
jgi:hypothetical protein